MLFQQLFEAESSTYTYLLADEESLEAVIIDPVVETAERDLQLISELGLKLRFILETHIHADHITGAGKIREATGAKTALAATSGVPCADMLLQEGQVLEFGKHKIQVLSTPGHTDSCLSYLCEGKVFTGDAILVRATGRTDFQQGSAAKLYDSILKKIFTLPEETVIYPAHDYKGFTSTTVGAEKTNNPRIGMGKSKEDFIRIMSELKLANPKKMHEAVPANLECGRQL